MGDTSRLRNPHLRATLAETLEVILPQKEESSGRTLNRSDSILCFSLRIIVVYLVLSPKLFSKNIH